MTAAIGLRDGQRRARPLSKNPRAGQQLIFLACAWLLPFACAPGSQHAAVTPPSRAVSTAVPPPASSAQPTQTVGAGAGADTGARTRTAARSEPSPFVEGVRLGYRAQLNIAGRRAVLTTDNLLLGLHDDGVRIEPNLLEGLQWDHAAYPRVFGSMPESGWFATEADENSVSSFWVQDNEQVWATLGGPELSYLVRTQRGSAPLSAPSDQEVAQLSSALEATAGCQSFTLVLLTLPRNAPKDADMPRIRAALRGHTELEGNAQFIELPFLTRRYLGVRGDLDTLRATREILSEAHVPGIAPELRCLNGAPTRTFAVDFRPKPGQAPSGKRIRRRSTGFVFDLRNP